MKIKIKYNHKIFSIILFSVAVLAMSRVLIDEFFIWGTTMEALFFNLSNIIFIAVVSYLFYRNGVKSSKSCSKFNRYAFAIIFILMLTPDFLAATSYFSSEDMPTSIIIFFSNIFFITPMFIVLSVIVFNISYFMGI
ncbi:MAG: hypothetical protein ABIC82_03765 [bacterium]